MKTIRSLNIGQEILIQTKDEEIKGIFCEVESNYLKAIGKGGLLYCVPLLIIQNVAIVGGLS